MENFEFLLVERASRLPREWHRLDRCTSGSAFIAGPNASQAAGVESLYFAQRRDLRAGRYGLPIRATPPEIKQAFSEYLYEGLFDNADIWAQLGSTGFNRAAFHDNYRKDNQYPSACPYCDLDTINGQGNYIVEHFLPRTHFPLLSLDSFNLFTACNACNTAPAGKGVRVVPSAGSPYFIQAGDHLRFTRDDRLLTISLAPERSFPPVGGLIGLLQLHVRYGTPNSYYQLRGRTGAFEQAMDPLLASGHQFDPDFVIGYISQFNAGAPLFFALRSWVRHEYIPGMRHRAGVT